MSNKFYQLDDIGYIGTQDVFSKEESERADVAVRSYIRSQKATETLWLERTQSGTGREYGRSVRCVQ